MEQENENNSYKQLFQKNIVHYIKQQHIFESTKKEINLKEWMEENLELIRELEKVVEHPSPYHPPETFFENQEFPIIPIIEERHENGKVKFFKTIKRKAKFEKELGRLTVQLENLNNLRKQQEELIDSNFKILLLHKLNPLITLDNNSFTTKKLIDDKKEHRFEISEEKDEICITPINCDILELKEEMIFEKARMREFILYLIKTITKNA